MMLAMARILARLLVSPEFGLLSKRQRAAIIESLMLTAVRPGPISDADRRALRLELMTLPWAWEVDRRAHDGLVDRRGLLLARLEDPALLVPFGRALARVVGRGRLGELVYTMMAALVYADGGSDHDAGALEPLGLALGLRASRAVEILDLLKDELVKAVVG